MTAFATELQTAGNPDVTRHERNNKEIPNDDAMTSHTGVLSTPKFPDRKMVSAGVLSHRNRVCQHTSYECLEAGLPNVSYQQTQKHTVQANMSSPAFTSSAIIRCAIVIVTWLPCSASRESRTVR